MPLQVIENMIREIEEGPGDVTASPPGTTFIRQDQIDAMVAATGLTEDELVNIWVYNNGAVDAREQE